MPPGPSHASLDCLSSRRQVPHAAHPAMLADAPPCSRPAVDRACPKHCSPDHALPRLRAPRMACSAARHRHQAHARPAPSWLGARARPVASPTCRAATVVDPLHPRGPTPSLQGAAGLPFPLVCVLSSRARSGFIRFLRFGGTG